MQTINSLDGFTPQSTAGAFSTSSTTLVAAGTNLRGIIVGRLQIIIQATVANGGDGWWAYNSANRLLRGYVPAGALQTVSFIGEGFFLIPAGNSFGYAVTAAVAVQMSFSSIYKVL